jgi:hypothetical protein
VGLITGSNPTLTAGITAPSIFSLSCNSNSLLVKDNSSYFSRFGITYEWTIVGAGGKSNSSETISSTASSFIILPGQLTAGTLQVQLTIKNSANLTNSTTANITIVGSNKLNVSVASSYNLTRKRNVPITIPLDVSNRCGGTLSYAWSYISSNRTSYSADAALTQTITTNDYTIPASTLLGPYYYTLQAVVTETINGSTFSGSSQFNLNIVNEDLTGTYSFANPITDGIFSTLDDLQISLALDNLLSYPPTYTWTCQNPVDTTCTGATSNSDTFTIAQASLVSYQNYTITSTASTASPDSRSFTKTFNIRGIRSTIGAEFLPETPYKPSSLQDLTVFPVIDIANANYFTWWKQLVDPPIVWVSGTGEGQVTHQSLEIPVFRMLDSELYPGTEYHFELQVDSSSATNISRKTLLFTTNNIPACTSFTKSPASGLATDTYTLSANGCADDVDEVLIYTFYVQYYAVSSTYYILRGGIKTSSITLKLSSKTTGWKVKVCDSLSECRESTPQTISFTSRRMLDSEILDDFNTMAEDPDNIPTATIIALISDTVDRETYDTIKSVFDNYVKSLEQNNYTRELVVSVYRAIIEYQGQILENEEILDMIKFCHEMIMQDGYIKQTEAREILDSFYKIVESRSYDQDFVAEFLEIVEKIFIVTLGNSPPRSINDGRISEDFYYARLFGDSLKGLSVPLNSINVTLPNEFEDFGRYKMYDLFIKSFKTDGLPIFLTYLAEVGYYERPKIVYYDTRSAFNETDNFILEFEVPYNITKPGLAVKCQIYSVEAGLWQNVDCTGKILDSKVKVTTSSFGTMRLITVEEDLVNASEEECEMNPAAFSIVCFWLSLITVVTIINYLTSRKRPELYNVVGAGAIPGSKRLDSLDNLTFHPDPRFRM